MNILTNINLNQNQLQNAVIHPLAMAPVSPAAGQIYYNSADGLIYRYNGAEWAPVGVVYTQSSSTGNVVTGLGSTGSVTTTPVVNLTLDGYQPVESGYIANNMTFQQALSALDAAVKNAVSGGGEVNQNAWSYVVVPIQSENATQQVTPNPSAITLSASSPTDSFSVSSGDQWAIVAGSSAEKKVTIGHKFSAVSPARYGSGTSVPQITVDAAGHVTAASEQTIQGAQYISGLTSDAQQQLNAKVSADLLGQPNGVATLDQSGLIPSTQLPSYVDDVVETYVVGETPYAADWLSTTQGGEPLTPQASIIYVVVGEGQYQNDQYRWGGTQYVLCNPSDVNSVNGKTGIVTLTQDDIGNGSTYVQFSQSNLDKLDGIEDGATANNITLNGAPNADPAFYAPTTPGSAGQVLLSSGSGAPAWGAMPQAFAKYTGTNAQLSASGGSFLWEIPNSVHQIGNAGIIVQVYDASAGDEVIADVNVDQSSYTISITINDSSGAGTLAAGTYRVVAFG